MRKNAIACPRQPIAEFRQSRSGPVPMRNGACPCKFLTARILAPRQRHREVFAFGKLGICCRRKLMFAWSLARLRTSALRILTPIHRGNGKLCAEHAQNLIYLVHTQCCLSLLQITNKAQSNPAVKSKILLCPALLFALLLYKLFNSHNYSRSGIIQQLLS